MVTKPLPATAAQMREAFRKWHESEDESGSLFDALCSLMSDRAGVTTRRRLVRVYCVVRRTKGELVESMHLPFFGGLRWERVEPAYKLDSFDEASNRKRLERNGGLNIGWRISVVRVSVYRKRKVSDGRS